MKHETNEAKDFDENKESGWEKYYWVIVIALVLIISVIVVIFLTRGVTAQMPSRNDTGYLQIAQGVALSHVWVYRHPGTPNFVCTDFAWTLATTLNNAGFKARIKKGRWFDQGNGTCSIYNYKYFRCHHEWVEIRINGKWLPLEATTGEPINLTTYKQFYK